MIASVNKEEIRNIMIQSQKENDLQELEEAIRIINRKILLRAKAGKDFVLVDIYQRFMPYVEQIEKAFSAFEPKRTIYNCDPNALDTPVIGLTFYWNL